MATSSEVKAGLDEVANKIRDQRAVVIKARQQASAASAALAGLPTQYGDVVSTVNAYGTADAFEANAKAELAKLTTEFNALKAAADQIAAVTV